MAYMSFDLDRAAGLAAAPAFGGSAAAFSAVEWTVIRLARRDRLATAKPAGRIGTMLRRMFGLDRANVLADPKLEALRRAAVRCWNGRNVLDRGEIDDLLGVGFRFDQIALLASHARA